MGAWGTGIFSNDIGADVREDFRGLVADGVEPGEATKRLVEEYGVGPDPQKDPDFWLALALTQHQLGRLLPEVKQHAFAVLEGDGDLHRWEPQDRLRRRRALRAGKERLDEPQPEPKRLRKRPRRDSALRPGQHLLFQLKNGRQVLLRVQRVVDERSGRRPSVAVLQWDSSQPLPTGKRLLKLRPFPDVVPREGWLGERYFGFSVFGPDPAERLELLPELAPLPRGATSDYRRTAGWVASWDELDDWFDESGQPTYPQTTGGERLGRRERDRPA